MDGDTVDGDTVDGDTVDGDRVRFKFVESQKSKGSGFSGASAPAAWPPVGLSWRTFFVASFVVHFVDKAQDKARDKGSHASSARISPNP